VDRGLSEAGAVRSMRLGVIYCGGLVFGSATAAASSPFLVVLAKAMAYCLAAQVWPSKLVRCWLTGRGWCLQRISTGVPLMEY